MGHQHGGFALLLDNSTHLVPQVQPGLIVQGRKRFIQQEQFRFQRQCADQRHLLPHTPGKLVWFKRNKFSQSIGIQQRQSLFPAFLVQSMTHFQSQQYVLLHRPPLQQMIPLKHIPHWTFPCGIQHFPSGRRHKSHDHAEHGGFSAAGWPDNSHKLPFLNGKGNILQGLRFPLRGLIAQAYVLKGDQHPLHVAFSLFHTLSYAGPAFPVTLCAGSAYYGNIREVCS